MARSMMADRAVFLDRGRLRVIRRNVMRPQQGSVRRSTDCRALVRWGHKHFCRVGGAFLIACVGCPKGSTDPSLGEISQTVLFHVSYENYAWGYQSEGWYIDSDGRVWQLATALHWWPEVTNILQGSEDTLYYPAAELEQSYADARDSLVAAIDDEELREKYLLIAEAAKGTYSTPVNTGADAGSFVIGCLAYDQEAERYRKVILSVTGDWTVTNLASSATELAAWLRNLVQQSVPGPVTSRPAA